MRYVSLVFLGVCLIVPGSPAVFAEDPIFSGPQKGEPLPDLPGKVLFEKSGDDNGLTNLAETDVEHPHRLIVFVHNLTRQSVGLVRPLTTYAATRADDGLRPALVFLGEDATALQERLTRARHALPKDVPVAISLDGVEGPGAYGLNRNVTLTILIASEGTVRANFAIVDPSIPVDLPKLLQAVCDVVGGDPPPMERLIKGTEMRRRSPNAPTIRRRPEPASEPAK